MNNSHRNTINLEQAEILSHEAFAGEQNLLTVHAPQIAEKARAGSFVHITCDASRPLRRPISIMRVDRKRGQVELLYKIFGEGTRLLSKREVGERLNIMGPIGTPFRSHMERPRPLLIGGGVGIPPMVFLADELRDAEETYPADWIDDAFRIAVADNVRKWRYILAILERWATEGRDDGTRQRDTETKRRWYTDEEFEQFFEH